MAAVPAWIAALIAGGYFVVFAGYNAWIVWQVYVAREHAPSFAPFFGGIAGLGAVLAMPLPPASTTCAMSVDVPSVAPPS